MGPEGSPGGSARTLCPMPRGKRTLLDEATLPTGEVLTLTQESGYFMVRADGMPLMSNMAHYSEEYMAVIGCEGLKESDDARVLVGGLGMGYTARSALDQLGPKGPKDRAKKQVSRRRTPRPKR